MKTPETKMIIHHIDKLVAQIWRRVNINSFMYALTVLVVLWLVVMTVRLQKQQNASLILSSDNYKMVLNNSSRMDARDKEYLDYIKRMVETWDKLQHDNPKLLVPKAPKERPVGLPPLTEKEMTRPKYEHPEAPATLNDGGFATPTPTPKTKTVKHKVKATPTPKPWYQKIF
jgi:hypothetical protein